MVSYGRTARVLYRLYSRLNRHRPLLQQRLLELKTGWDLPDSLFTRQSMLRFTKYHELSLHVVCNSVYQLTGRQLTPEEQERIFLLSIFGPLYDDLLDDNILSAEKVAELTHSPESFEAETDTARLVRQLYLWLLQMTPDAQRLKEKMAALFYWQQASLEQKDPRIEEKRLYEISFQKSFQSLLLFHAILDHYPDNEIENMLYPLAGLLQLTNDAFDVYKDLQAGMYTIPNLYPDYEKIERRFMQTVGVANRRIAALPYPAKAKTDFAITFHALHAMGRMALWQLRRNTHHKPLKELSRRELVCDMDNLPQKLRWIREVRQLVNFRGRD